MKKFIGILMACLVFSAVPASAVDFPTALSEMFWNAPAGADVAGMGNAWVATPLFSSYNPAIAAIADADMKNTATVTHGQISFADGPTLRTTAVTATVNLPKGVLQVTPSYADSSNYHVLFVEGEGPLDIRGFEERFNLISSRSVAVQYGLEVAPRTYLGAGYTYGKSKLRMTSLYLTPATSLGFDVRSEGTSHTATLGAAYQPAKGVTFGLSYSHAWEHSEDLERLSGFEETTDSDVDQFRAGFGWQVLPATFIAADYQYLDLAGEKLHQVFAGVEQGIYQDAVYLYAGWTADAPTAGVGIYLPRGGLNAGYIHHGNDDLAEYWGSSSTWVVSGYLSF